MLSTETIAILYAKLKIITYSYFINKEEKI